MSTETKEVGMLIEHPLEEEFDIESGTTMMSKTERVTDLVLSEEYDSKDNEIENQFQEVYDAALAAFEDQVAEAELVEGKYKARNMEVATQLLNTALSAAKEKSMMKQHKDKTSVAKGKLGAKTVNNNLIVADHNAVLRSFLNAEED